MSGGKLESQEEDIFILLTLHSSFSTIVCFFGNFKKSGRNIKNLEKSGRTFFKKSGNPVITSSIILDLEPGDKSFTAFII